ncbi:MAG: transposase [Acidobacteriaceae bacterium]|nr:transposase [Acidobacteriaceae bacterium]
MLEQIPGSRRVTVAGDKGYDTKEFVAECRNLNATPHVAQNQNRPGGSAIDGRTVRHTGYRISQLKRKRIEESFGWLKNHTGQTTEVLAVDGPRNPFEQVTGVVSPPISVCPTHTTSGPDKHVEVT